MGKVRTHLKEMETAQDHTGAVSLCTRALEHRAFLSRDEVVYLLKNQAKHLAAMNPEVWHRQIMSALRDALTEAAGDPEQEAELLAAMSFAEIVLLTPLQIEVGCLRPFQALCERHPECRRYGSDLYHNLAFTYAANHEYAEAERHYRSAIAICTEVYEQTKNGHYLEKRAESLHNLAEVLAVTGRTEEARSSLGEAKVRLTEAWYQPKYLSVLAEITFAEGDLVTARALYEEALTIVRNDEYTHVDLLHGLANVEAASGDLIRARALAGEAMLLAYRLPYVIAVRDIEALLGQIGGDDPCGEP